MINVKTSISYLLLMRYLMDKYGTKNLTSTVNIKDITKKQIKMIESDDGKDGEKRRIVCVILKTKN